MNKNIKLAVAGAILATASVANAGIIIPAGDWTLDIGGVVNTYATWSRATGAGTAGYGLLMAGDGSSDLLQRVRQGGAGVATTNRSTANMTTGLLPNYLSVSGTTRQNDLDVSFTISINPGSSTTNAGIQNSGTNGQNQENRQAFLTFGDKSWGSVKVGKDLGIFASDAILNDMTLLGVGSGAGSLAGNTTTLGRIGTGFIYADWKAQIAYTTPNFNGFQATAGITQAFNNQDIYFGLGTDLTTGSRGGASNAYEGKASYSFAANDVTGKVWVSGIAQKLDTGARAARVAGQADNEIAWATDIGANVNFAGFGLTGYYYTGEGIGQTVQFFGGLDRFGNKRDSDGGYVQATYVLPTKTKVGVSWGESRLDQNGALDNTLGADLKDRMWTVGLYHPLTKHLNLVAEYSDVKSELGNLEAKGRSGSLGAILFF